MAFTLLCPTDLVQRIRKLMLSRQFDFSETDKVPEPILPSSCIVGPLQWTVQSVVDEAQKQEPDLGGGPLGCLYVPHSTQSQVLQWRHSSKFIKRRFWWPTMKKEVHKFIRACKTCAQHKSSHQCPAGLLQSLPIPSQPWSHFSMDFISSLPNSQGLSHSG